MLSMSLLRIYISEDLPDLRRLDLLFIITITITNNRHILPF